MKSINLKILCSAHNCRCCLLQFFQAVDPSISDKLQVLSYRIFCGDVDVNLYTFKPDEMCFTT